MKGLDLEVRKTYINFTDLVYSDIPNLTVVDCRTSVTNEGYISVTWGDEHLNLSVVLKDFNTFSYILDKEGEDSVFIESCFNDLTETYKLVSNISKLLNNLA